jgi:hypothetical protein
MISVLSHLFLFVFVMYTDLKSVGVPCLFCSEAHNSSNWTYGMEQVLLICEHCSFPCSLSVCLQLIHAIRSSHCIPFTTHSHSGS